MGAPKQLGVVEGSDAKVLNETNSNRYHVRLRNPAAPKEEWQLITNVKEQRMEEITTGDYSMRFYLHAEYKNNRSYEAGNYVSHLIVFLCNILNFLTTLACFRCVLMSLGPIRNASNVYTRIMISK